MTLPRLRDGSVLAACLWLQLPAAAQQLPDPLTLEAALQAGADHPAVALGQAGLAQLQAEAGAVQARDDVDIGAALAARTIDPAPTAIDQDHNDSLASVYARKRLYDFGHTTALESAAMTSVAGGALRARTEATRHRIAVMSAFFDVLLADLEYVRDNEAMAVAYVQADRSRDRNELGQLSEVELLQHETAYQEFRMRRARSLARQRSTRAQLAQLLNRPEQLSANLVRPDLSSNDRPLPEYETLVAAALDFNPPLLALRADLEAARLQVEAVRTEHRPVLTGSVAASAYERDTSSHNPLEAELRLEIPLYPGRRIDAGVARAQADVYRLTAELRQQELQLRQRLLEIWLDIQTLQAQREQVDIFRQSRQLNFDRAQSEYELELKTDFGDALVGQSESALLDAQTEFALALDWARLTAMTGEPYSPFLTGPTPTPTGNVRQ
jgi:outer membrane protein TolC